MKILISGSTGFIGSALVTFLKEKGHQVYRLVRAKADLKPDEIAWDVHQGVINPQLLEGFDTIVHLAGENLLGRWTQTKKDKIRNSRVEGSRLLTRNLCALKTPPSLFICASAVGYYGCRGEEILTEQNVKGEEFLAKVCEGWEDATRPASEKGIRTLNLRFGVVLSEKGGTLKLMLPIFKLGLGGKVGSGNQYVSWIALPDLLRVVDFVMTNEEIAGPVNTVAPFPVTNAELTKILGHVLHRPTFFSVPQFAVKLLFGELGEETLLCSVRAIPKKLEEAGFKFLYPHLDAGLEHLLKKNEKV